MPDLPLTSSVTITWVYCWASCAALLGVEVFLLSFAAGKTYLLSQTCHSHLSPLLSFALLVCCTSWNRGLLAFLRCWFLVIRLNLQASTDGAKALAVVGPRVLLHHCVLLIFSNMLSLLCVPLLGLVLICDSRFVTRISYSTGGLSVGSISIARRMAWLRYASKSLSWSVHKSIYAFSPAPTYVVHQHTWNDSVRLIKSSKVGCHALFPPSPRPTALDLTSCSPNASRMVIAPWSVALPCFSTRLWDGYCIVELQRKERLASNHDVQSGMLVTSRTTYCYVHQQRWSTSMVLGICT